VFSVRSLEFTFRFRVHLLELVIQVKCFLRKVVVVVSDTLSNIADLSLTDLHQLLNMIYLVITLFHLIDKVLVPFECQVDLTHAFCEAVFN